MQNRRPGGQTGGRRRIRVQPRFFIFLVSIILILLLLVFFINRQGTGASRAQVQTARLGNTYSGEIVIVRDEKLIDAESITRIEFVAEEGAMVYKGNVICKVYSAGYNQTEINKLEATREQIRQYHSNQVMNNYADAQLEVLDDNIGSLALEVRTLVQGLGTGSLSNLETQLGTAMTARQDYLQAKFPDDQTLSGYYKDEASQLRKIESWTTTYTATDEGLVSFYSDGYELAVNADTYEQITPAEVRSMLQGNAPEIEVAARGRQALYRTVRADRWYVLLLSNDKSWNPIEGQTYMMQLEGFDSYVVSATVTSSTLTGSGLLVRMQVDADVSPVLNLRTSQVLVGEFIDGLSVPTSAIRYQDDLVGVVVSDVAREMFIPVTVLSYDNDTAFIRPVYQGSLSAGQWVLLFN